MAKKKNKLRRKQDPLALAAIFISLLALVATIWEGLESRRYNRISVTPKLVYSMNLAKNDQFAGYYVRNTGTGMAIIESYRLFYEAEEITKDVSLLKKRLLSDSLQFWEIDKLFSATELLDDFYLSPESELKVFGTSAENYLRDFENWKKELIYDKVALKIRYRSLYGDYDSLIIPSKYIYNTD